MRFWSDCVTTIFDIQYSCGSTDVRSTVHSIQRVNNLLCIFYKPKEAQQDDTRREGKGANNMADIFKPGHLEVGPKSTLRQPNNCPDFQPF